MSDDAPFLRKDFAALVRDLLGFVGTGVGGNTALTDTTEGSVVRTLMEAFAREMAVAYDQLGTVYRQAYLDTAEGVALDNVVALLGLERHGAGHVEGRAVFARRQPLEADVSIPAGTLVAGRDVPLFETTRAEVLAAGTLSVTVPIRSVEPGGETVPANSLSVMPRPITGIETVTNPADLILVRREETDDELRDRARHALERANQGTPQSLREAVRSIGVSDVGVEDQMPGRPGQVDIVIGDADVSDDLLQRIRDAVERVRPAGIVVSVNAAMRVWIQVNATLVLDRPYPERERRQIEDGIRQDLVRYFDGLGVGDTVRWAKVRNFLTAPDAVADVLPLETFPFLDPFEGRYPDLVNVAGQRLLREADIRIGSTDRAGLDPVALPIRLKLELPQLDVAVDVVLTPPDGSSLAVIEEQIRGPLNGVLGGLGPDSPITWDGLFAAIPDTLKDTGVWFTVVHERDARVEELRAPGDQDRLVERERPQFRALIPDTGDGGGGA